MARNGKNILFIILFNADALSWLQVFLTKEFLTPSIIFS
jgi:hypothetical protein